MLRKGRQQALFEDTRIVPVQLQELDVIERALLAIESDRPADNTVRAYKRIWEQWARWCARRDLRPILPIDVDAMCGFLQELAEGGASRSTIDQAIFALSYFDKRYRITPTDPEPLPLSTHWQVVTWFKVFRKGKPSRFKPAPVIPPADFRALVQSLYRTRARQSARREALLQMRDRCLLLLGYFAAMRRSELAAVTIQNIAGAARGLTVLIPRSKTDQQGIGEERVLLPQGEVLMCPVDAWNVWTMALIEADRLRPDSPLFPVILRNGTIGTTPMKGDTIHKLIAHRSAAAGLRATPHSLRAMFATHAIMAGHPESEVMWHGRWATQRNFRLYVRRGKAWTYNPTAGLSLLSKANPTEEG